MNDDTSLTTERLLGAWRLVSAIAVDENGRELALPYGPNPMGRLVLNADGRMMAVLCDGRTQLPAGVERAYASCCGNFRIDGERLVTRVDAAADPERIGGDEVRDVELRGEVLVLRPPRRADGSRRKLTWHREGPP